MFKRLMLSANGRTITKHAMKIGITTSQACNLIADSLVQRIPHYVPIVGIEHAPEVFGTCEPLLYSHLLPPRFMTVATRGRQSGTAETPATLLCELVGLNLDQISENVPLRDFGLDSLGGKSAFFSDMHCISSFLTAVRYSGVLTGHFGIKIGQLELLGSITIGDLNNIISQGGSTWVGDKSGTAMYGAPIEPILADRIAYGDPYTTHASPYQSRIWLTGVRHPSLAFIPINT
jgi:hypothetical protein